MNAKRVLLGAAVVAAIAMVYRTLTSDDSMDHSSSTDEGVDRIEDSDDSTSSPATAATQG